MEKNKNCKIYIQLEIGDVFAVSETDGEKIYQKLIVALKNCDRVSISFANIELFTTHFIDTCLGKLYKTFDSEFLQQHLFIDDYKYMQKEDLQLIKRCCKNADLFYKKTDKIFSSQKMIISHDDLEQLISEENIRKMDES